MFYVSFCQTIAAMLRKQSWKLTATTFERLRIWIFAKRLYISSSFSKISTLNAQVEKEVV